MNWFKFIIALIFAAAIAAVLLFWKEEPSRAPAPNTATQDAPQNELLITTTTRPAQADILAPPATAAEAQATSTTTPASTGSANIETIGATSTAQETAQETQEQTKTQETPKRSTGQPSEPAYEPATHEEPPTPPQTFRFTFRLTAGTLVRLTVTSDHMTVRRDVPRRQTELVNLPEHPSHVSWEATTVIGERLTWRSAFNVAAYERSREEELGLPQGYFFLEIDNQSSLVMDTIVVNRNTPYELRASVFMPRGKYDCGLYRHFTNSTVELYGRNSANQRVTLRYTTPPLASDEWDIEVHD